MMRVLLRVLTGVAAVIAGVGFVVPNATLGTLMILGGVVAWMFSSVGLSALGQQRNPIEREVDEDRKLVADIVDSWMGKPPDFVGEFDQDVLEQRVEERLRNWQMAVMPRGKGERGIQPRYSEDASWNRDQALAEARRNPSSGSGGLLQIRPRASEQVQITSIFGVPAHLMGVDEIRHNVGLSSHGEPPPPPMRGLPPKPGLKRPDPDDLERRAT